MEDNYIEPERFVERMENHWTNKLKNISSPTLRKVWEQLGKAFVQNIITHDNEMGKQWIVVQPPTGSGKTQGAILYSAMLSTELDPLNHPGVLIVTRLKEEADNIAGQINELADGKVALAHHSDSETAWDELREWPTLVITHKAYEQALDYIGQDGTIGQTFPFFHNRSSFMYPHRQLVIIDECLDIVDESQVSENDLQFALNTVPINIQRQYPKEYGILNSLYENLKTHAFHTLQDSGKDKREMMVSGIFPEDMDNIDFPGLRAKMRSVRLDRKILQKSERAENMRFHQILNKVLKAVDVMFKTWIYYANHNGRYTWNTARLLVPDSVKGAVVLDASASTNVTYELFDTVPWSAPEGARIYRNVTLHVSRGHRVGKQDMEKDARKATREIVADLNTRLEGQDVFIVTHKAVETVLLTYSSDFTMKTGHWGAIQGRNIWKDCDTVVIFGLPYMPNTSTANTFMALKGPQDTAWLNNPEERRFKDYPDIRKALKTGWLVTDIVQAINRIRCRKVIDAYGNCPRAEVYIMFRDDSEANEILEIIRKEMPGINIVEDWKIDIRKKKVKQSGYEAALRHYLQVMPSGKVSKMEMANTLGASTATMNRLMGKLKSPEGDTKKILDEFGITIALENHGGTQRTYFMKI